MRKCRIGSAARECSPSASVGAEIRAAEVFLLLDMTDEEVAGLEVDWSKSQQGCWGIGDGHIALRTTAVAVA